MAGADQDVMLSWLDQPLTDEEDDHEEELDAWLSLDKEMAEPLETAL
jgi:hypothetical protein